MNNRGHVEINRYNPRQLIRIMPLPRIFLFAATCEYDVVNESWRALKTDRFVELVYDIQAHLVQSQPTRAVYVELLAEVYDTLEGARSLRPQPTDEDVQHYFRDDFPHVHAVPAYHPSGSSSVNENDTPCSWRAKGEILNEIHIGHNPVCAIQAERETPLEPPLLLSADAYAACTAVILLDALRYSLVKYFFAPIIPAPWGLTVDALASQKRWATWDIELRLLGCHLCWEWRPADRPNDMRWHMTDLLAQTCNESHTLAGPSGDEELRLCLQSLKTASFHKIRLIGGTEVGAHPPPAAHRERVETAFYCPSALTTAIVGRIQEARARCNLPVVESSIGGPGHCRSWH